MSPGSGVWPVPITMSSTEKNTRSDGDREAVPSHPAKPASTSTSAAAVATRSRLLDLMSSSSRFRVAPSVRRETGPGCPSSSSILRGYVRDTHPDLEPKQA